MRFTWDPEKREVNIARHGLDFVDAQRVFRGLFWTFEDRRRSYGERRHIGYGLLEALVVTVVFTEPEEDTFRIISMRKATSHEQRSFFRRFKD